MIKKYILVVVAIAVAIGVWFFFGKEATAPIYNEAPLVNIR